MSDLRRSIASSSEVVEGLVEQLSRTLGVDPPRVIWTRGGLEGPGASVGVPDRDGVRTLRFSRERAQTWSLLQLRGCLAHELHHVSNQDVGVAIPKACQVPVALLGVGGLLMVVLSLVAFVVIAAAAAAAGVGVPVKTEPSWWWLPGAVAAAMVGRLLLRASTVRDQHLRTRFHPEQLGSQVVELRADITAARAVGKEPVLQWLRRLDAYERRRSTRATRWFYAVVLGRLQTHPPTQLRIAVVDQDDGSQPALQLAQRQLERQPQSR